MMEGLSGTMGIISSVHQNKGMETVEDVNSAMEDHGSLYEYSQMIEVSDFDQQQVQQATKGRFQVTEK